MKAKRVVAILALSYASVSAFGQSNSEKSRLDSLSLEVAKIKKVTSALSNLKVSGYLQMQYQKADTVGAQTYNGGNFGKAIDNRFAVRRARLKFAYEESFGSVVFQLDATEGGVNIKNAYINLKAPFAPSLSITGGVFDRPFGYAIEYSSSSMEVIERPIIFQTLLPGEQDLGAMLVYAPKNGLLNGLVVKGGFFNGNGINADVDKYKDFIGKISYNGFKLGPKASLNLGASLYSGSVYNPTNAIYKMTEIGGVKGFASSTKDIGARLERQYVGVDGEFSFTTELGKTSLVSEYLWGKQPGASSSTKSPSYSTIPSTVAYLRNVAGGYITLIQQLHKVSLFGRYDWYDPNTDVSKDQIGATTNGLTPTNAGDIMLKSTSLGAMYEPNKSIRLTAQYDLNRFESTKNGMFSVAGLKNNLFSIRVQYKF